MLGTQLSRKGRQLIYDSRYAGKPQVLAHVTKLINSTGVHVVPDKLTQRLGAYIAIDAIWTGSGTIGPGRLCPKMYRVVIVRSVVISPAS